MAKGKTEDQTVTFARNTTKSVGLKFSRNSASGVNVEIDGAVIDLSADEWANILAVVSHTGPTAETKNVARMLQFGSQAMIDAATDDSAE